MDGISTIEMEGNGTNNGKGATWTTIDSEYLKISEFKFDFDVVKGDSFNAAGLLFNVREEGNKLSGYLFCINFDSSYSFSGISKAAICEFTYTIGENHENFDSVRQIQAIPITTTGSGRSERFTGSVAIQVTDTGYIFTSNFTSDIVLNLDTTYANSFGFFSDHYGHSCDDIGYFKLDNVSVSIRFI